MDAFEGGRSISSTISFNVTLGASVDVNVVDTTLTMSGVLSSSNDVSKSGDGTLIFSGANTYTGTTTISDGALQVNNGGTLGSGDVTNDGTLISNRSTNNTFSFDISGTGGLTQQGTGTLTLAGNNTYSGVTTITAGTLQIGNVSGSSGSLGTGSVVNDATLSFRRSGTNTVDNLISGTGDLVQQSSTLVLTADNTYTGTSTINANATLKIGDGGTTGSLGTGDVLSGSPSSAGGLRFDRSDSVTVNNEISGAINLRQIGSGTLTVAGDISGVANVFQEGAGTLVLSGTNTYTGTTTIDSTRTLRIGSASAIGSGAVTVSGTLDLNGYSQTLGALSGSGTVTSGVVGAATLTVGDNDETFSFSGTIEDGSGTIALTKQGTGKLTLNGNNTYSGGTTIAAGTLRVVNLGGASLGTGSIVNNATLRFYSSGTTTIADAISGSGELIQEAGTLILSGNNTYTGTTTIDPLATLKVGNGGTTGTLGSGDVIGGGAPIEGSLNFNRSDSLTVNNNILGEIDVRQQGAGVLVLAGTNVYTGTTTIDSGKTLRVGSANAIGSGAVTVSGTLDLNGYSTTVGKLTGSGAVSSSVAANSTLSIGNNIPQSFTFSGLIEDGSGTVALTKLGNGTFTLDGTNTYSGDTTISAGALKVDGASAIPSGSGKGDVIVDGTLDLNSYSITVNGLGGSGTVTTSVAGSDTLTVGGDDQTSTFDGIIEDGAGTVAVTKTGTGTVTLAGINTYSGDTTLSAGTLEFELNGLGSGDIVFDGGKLQWADGNAQDVSGQFAAIGSGDTAILDTNGNDVTLAQVISGVGSLTKTGDGSLTLTGANTYTGTTTISQGTVVADTIVVGGGHSNLGNATSAVVLGDATHQGTLSYTGNSATFTRGFTVNAGGGRIDIVTEAETLTVATGGISAGGALTIGGAGDASISSVIGGSGSLVKEDEGTLTLSGANTYTGTTTISQGTVVADTIVVGGSNSNLGNATSAVVLGDATHQGTLSYTGNSATFTRGFTVNSGGGRIDTVSGTETLTVATGGISTSGALTIGGAGDTSVSSVLSGAGSLIKVGAGTLIVSGTNTYSGDTTISAGALKVDGASAIPSGSGKGDVIVDGTLDLNSYSITVNGLGGSGTVTTSVAGSDTLTVGGDDQTSTFDGTIEDGAGTVAVTKTGTGTVTLAGINTYSGDTTLSAGTLEFELNGLGSGDIVFDGGKLQWADGNAQDVSGQFAAIGSGDTAILDTNGNDVTLAQVISGVGSLTKTGDGSLTLTGANTYSGGTTVDAGHLQFDTGSVPSTGSIYIDAEGALNATGAYGTASAWLGSGKIDTGSTGTLALAANESSSLSLGSYADLYLGAVSSATFSGTLTPTGGVYRLGGGDGVLTVSSVLADSGGATSVSVRGDVILSATNTFTGGTTLDRGSLSIASANAIGGSSTSIDFSGGILQVTGTTITNLDSHTVNWSTFDGGIDIASSANTFTISQNISGSGGLAKLGAGTLIVSGTNTYSGDTTISAGALKVDGASAIPSGSGKGDVIVDGTLDLNSYSITVNGLGGSGTVTTSVAGSDTLTVGGDDQTSTFDGTIEDGSGEIALTKIGSGTFTLTGNSTYTGVTEVDAGLLVLDGNLNSHVRDTGGSVAGWFFRDPDLTAAVRKALGLSAQAVLTQNDLLLLTSLTADSNAVSDLKGLENALNLQSLTLLPRDFSVAGSLAETEYSASLEWLSGLNNLEVLTLQVAGITDAVLDTLGSPDLLHTLDVRYNALEVIPQSTVELASLSSLLVYGNLDITDNPRVGLENLAGSLIDIDLGADHPELATTIEDLAAALYNLPIEIYEYLVNSIEFQAYAGAMKGPLAVLQTGAGNAWDTASLLAGLFIEGGILEETEDIRTQDYKYVSGRVHLPIETAMEYFGASDPEAVEQMVDNAGLNPEVLVDGFGDPVGVVFDHVWLEARFPLGGEDWVSLDPSWKFQEHADVARNILDDVSWDADFSTSDFFAELRNDLPSEYYESLVREYLAQNESTTSIADLVYDGPIIIQSIDSLPTELPYSLWDTDHDWDPESVDPRPVQEYADIPEIMTHRLRVTLEPATGDAYLDSGLLYVPEISLSTLTIRPTLALSSFVRPELMLGDQSLVQSTTLLNPDSSMIITIEYYQPGDVDTPTRDTTHGTAFFDSIYVAGNYYAVMVDARQVTQELIKEQWREINEAAIDYMDGQPLDMDASIGGLLNLANLEYVSQLNTASEAIYDIAAAKRNISQVGFGLTRAGGAGGGFHQPGTGTPYSLHELTPDHAAQLHIPIVPERFSFDLTGLSTGFATIDGDDTHEYALKRIVRHTTSALEHAVLEGLVNANAMSTIKSFQIANDQSIPIIEIAPFTSSGTISSTLSLSTGAESHIATLSSQGYTVWVPEDETDLDDWHGVGYYVENSDNSHAVHYISGQQSGGAFAGLIGFLLGIPSGPNQDQSPDPISFANGVLTHDETDFTFPGLGHPLEFSRHYQSDQTGSLTYDSDRGLGEGWSFTYSDRLEDSSDPGDPVGTKIWFADDGMRWRFEPDGMGGYITPDAIFGTLVDNGTGFGFTWTDKYGNVVQFDDADGNGISRLEEMADRYGNGVEVTYDGAHIDTVSDLVTPSRWIEFSYTGDYITSIEDFTGRTWTLAYDGDDRLESVSAPTDGDTPLALVEYDYYTNDTLDGLLKTVTNANGRDTEFSYYPNRWGFEVKFAEGDVQTLSYNAHRGRTAYIDERGLVTYYTYNEDGNTVEEVHADRTTRAYTWVDNLKMSSTDAFGQTETYDYDANGNLTDLTDRLGYLTTYTYTDYSNLETVTRHNGTGTGDDEVTTYSYIVDGFGNDDKLETIEDGEGNITTITYGGADGARGLPDTITSPLGTATGGDPDDYITTYTYNDAGQVIARDTRAASGVPIDESFTYDDRGWMLTSTDANGEVSTYTYDLLGHLKTRTLPDPDGGGGNPAPATSYAYDPKGNLLSSTLTSTSPDRVTSYVYNPMHWVTRIENPDGTYRTRQYDRLGNVIAETDESGNLTRYRYDNRNRVTAAIADDGTVVAIGYDGGGRIVAITDQRGNITEYEYDELSRLTKTIDALGGETARTYDDASNLDTETDALGNVTAYDYDLIRRLTTVTEADPDAGGPLSSPVTGYEYDANSNLVEITDALNRETVYTYDELGRMIMVTLPDPDAGGPLASPEIEYEYDAVGNLVSVTDALDNVTTYDYDALNRLTTITEADPDSGGALTSPVTTYLYNEAGNRSGMTDALGRDTVYEYDKVNQLIRIVAPDPDDVGVLASPVTEYSYDASGNRISVTDPLGEVTRFGFDRLHRLTSVASADGGVNSYTYDAAGNRISSTDPIARTTAFAFDALNRLTGTTDPREEVTTFGYDAVGNQTSIIDPESNETDFVFDGLNRLIERIDPLLESTLYEYDAVDNVTEITDREGRVRTFTYDDLDRLSTETWLVGMSTVNTLTFTYDPVGNILAADDANSAYTLVYDNLYRLIQSDNVGTPGVPNVVLDYEYDAVGNRRLASDDSGVAVESIYDDLNRLITRTWEGGGIDAARIDFGYNARSERTSAERFSDLLATQQIGRSSYAYDLVGRTSGISHFDDMDAAIAEYEYTHDLAGQISQWLHHGETIDFTHDDAGQLTDADYVSQADEDYAYDANGNRTGGGLVVDPNNQIASDGTYNYDYDDEGNLILKTHIGSGEYTEYVYDHRNRMISATTYSSGAAVLQEVEFTYDVFDRRVAKTVDDDGAGTNAAETTYTVYDGEHAWVDFDDTPAVTARYLFGDRIDEIIARWQPGGGTAWYLTDHLGTVGDLVDDTGTLINTITYDSFGNVLTHTNAAVGDRFSYTGREYDAELDLYYYRARYYDPQLGRFISQDPIGFAGGDENLYRYVGNNPTTFVDPSGLYELVILPESLFRLDWTDAQRQRVADSLDRVESKIPDLIKEIDGEMQNLSEAEQASLEPWLEDFKSYQETILDRLKGDDRLIVDHWDMGSEGPVGKSWPAGREGLPGWVQNDHIAFNDNGTLNWNTMSDELLDSYLFHELLHLANADKIHDGELEGELYNAHNIQGMINSGIANNLFYKDAKRKAGDDQGGSKK